MIIGNQINRSDIAGVVVLYNSTEQVFDNIKTYLDQIDELYIVDNSDKPIINVDQYISQIPKIRYIANGNNKGIAYALNVGVKAALEDGYSYLLTMDDDSRAPENMIANMCKFINEYPLTDRIGIISVSHSKPLKNAIYRKVLFTMTSGNLLNLYAYQQVGPYDENLFIDHVDHEFGLRLNLLNYEVIEIADIKLIHKLGMNKTINFFSYKYKYVSHSPLRLYYFIRNGFYITKRYFFSAPIFCIKILKLMFIELMKSFLLDDSKKYRFYYLIKAVRDGYFKNLGKIST